VDYLFTNRYLFQEHWNYFGRGRAAVCKRRLQKRKWI